MDTSKTHGPRHAPKKEMSIHPASTPPLTEVAVEGKINVGYLFKGMGLMDSKSISSNPAFLAAASLAGHIVSERKKEREQLAVKEQSPDTCVNCGRQKMLEGLYCSKCIFENPEIQAKSKAFLEKLDTLIDERMTLFADIMEDE